MFFKRDSRKKSEPSKADLELAGIYYQRGDDLTRQHRFSEAEQCYLNCLSVLEPTALDSKSLPALWELSRCYSMLNVIGRMSTDEKKRSEATEWLKKSLVIDEKLAELSGTPQAYDDLACSYSGLGAMTYDISYCEKALAIWQDLHRKYPNEQLYGKRIETEQFNIGKLKELISGKKQG